MLNLGGFMKLEKSKTYENLARAFAGECQARTRYEFIEYGARYNGYKAVAEIIDKVVFQEFNHARMIYTAIHGSKEPEISNIPINAGFPFKEKWDLIENLRLASEDEKDDAKFYTEAIKTAEKEGFSDIVSLFSQIKEVELHHSKLFLELHNQMKDKTLYKKAKAVKWICPDCGRVYVDTEAPEECPLCKAKQGSFEILLPAEFTSYQTRSTRK